MKRLSIPGYALSNLQSEYNSPRLPIFFFFFHLLDNDARRKKASEVDVIMF